MHLLRAQAVLPCPDQHTQNGGGPSFLFQLQTADSQHGGAPARYKAVHVVACRKLHGDCQVALRQEALPEADHMGLRPAQTKSFQRSSLGHAALDPQALQGRQAAQAACAHVYQAVVVEDLALNVLGNFLLQAGSAKDCQSGACFA